MKLNRSITQFAADLQEIRKELEDAGTRRAKVLKALEQCKQEYAAYPEYRTEIQARNLQLGKELIALNNRIKGIQEAITHVQWGLETAEKIRDNTVGSQDLSSYKKWTEARRDTPHMVKIVNYEKFKEKQTDRALAAKALANFSGNIKW